MARAVAVVVLLSLLAYGNSLRNGLVYDDVIVVSLNGAAHDPLDWRTILLTPSWFALGHATGQLEWQPHGCDRAAERGVPIERIINTMPADELLAWTAA